MHKLEPELNEGFSRLLRSWLLFRTTDDFDRAVVEFEYDMAHCNLALLCDRARTRALVEEVLGADIVRILLGSPGIEELRGVLHDVPRGPEEHRFEDDRIGERSAKFRQAVRIDYPEPDLRDLFRVDTGTAKTRERDDDRRQSASTYPVSGGGPTLMGWADILEAIEVPNSRANQKRVKKFNESNVGPITYPNQKTPVVRKDALLLWWDGITRQGEEAAKQRSATDALLENRYERRELGFQKRKRPNARGQGESATP